MNRSNWKWDSQIVKLGAPNMPNELFKNMYQTNYSPLKLNHFIKHVKCQTIYKTGFSGSVFHGYWMDLAVGKIGGAWRRNLSLFNSGIKKEVEGLYFG